MKIRQLIYFVHTAELGSISAAAAFLKVAQPAVSRQLLQLEQELGATLVLRHGRGISLTDAGQTVLTHAKDILARTALIRQDLASLSSTPRGKVSLGVPEMIAPILIPALLNRLKSTVPDIQLNVHQGLSDEIRKALINHTLDIGIFYSNRPNPNFVNEVLHEDELHLIGPPQNLRGLPAEIELSQIGCTPLVLPAVGHELRQLVDAAAQGRGIHLNVTYEIGALTVIKELIKAQGVSTILPLIAGWPEIEHNKLHYIRLRKPTLVRPLLLATLPTGLSTASRVVARLARQEFLGLLRNREIKSKPTALAV